MKRLLLGLLKLLLQLVILALTGKWVKIGAPSPQASPARATAKPPKNGKPRPKQKSGASPARRKVFDRARRPVREEPATLEEIYLELEHHLPGAEAVPSTEALLATSEAVRRPRRKRQREAPQPTGRMSLARALRDRRSLQEAVVLGAAIAPRRRNPPF